ncbi:hypothetical protein JCM3765_004332 [Sporobolomyces pararoseus]
MTQSSFPVEIMNEIFRSSDLDSQTLARCCRLAHRYSESAQKWLYHHVNLQLSQRKAKRSDRRDLAPKLSPSTEKLLSLLGNNSHLAALVRSVKSETQFDDSDEFGHRRFEGMISRLCNSAPLLDSLDFSSFVGTETGFMRPEWDERALPHGHTERLDRYIEVKGVDLTPEVFEFLSHLVNLRVLHIKRAVRNSLGSPFEYDLGLTKLQSLRIHTITPDFDIKQFLSHSAATIRDLQIPYNYVFDLNLSEYPQLNRLELTMYKVDEYKAWGEEEPEEFWRRTEGCTKLRTLAFAYKTISTDQIFKLFGFNGGFGDYKPSSLHRVDLMDQFALDDVATIIYSGEVKQLGIKEETWDGAVKYEVLRLMCKDQGVELIHLDEPEELQDKKSTFPLEVIEEIFRSSELDKPTLASCCLLSRKYLKVAKKWLYHHIHIRLPGKNFQGLEGRIFVQEYSRSAARLLSTLQAKPALGRLVQSLRPEGGDAVASFFALAPNLNTLDLTFREQWVHGALRQLDPENLHRIEEVRIQNLSHLSSNFLSQLHNLRRLYVSWIPEHLAPPSLGTRTLHTLRLSVLPGRFDLKTFLSPVSSTIEDLQIPIEALFDLKLSNYPHLKRLELFLDGIELDEDGFEEEVGGCFYKLYNQCSRLSTLAFHLTHPLSPGLEERIFGSSGGLGSWNPREVRRIEFTNEVSVDRLLMFLYRGFVAELGINYDWVSEATWKTVAFICQDAGVELIKLAQ